MDSFDVHEAQVHFYEIIKRVAAGETVTITRGGKPVAQLVPYKSSTTRKRKSGTPTQSPKKRR